jgi:ribosomal protein S27E
LASGAAQNRLKTASKISRCRARQRVYNVGVKIETWEERDIRIHRRWENEGRVEKCPRCGYTTTLHKLSPPNVQCVVCLKAGRPTGLIGTAWLRHGVAVVYSEEIDKA